MRYTNSSHYTPAHKRLNLCFNNNMAVCANVHPGSASIKAINGKNYVSGTYRQ